MRDASYRAIEEIDLQVMYSSGGNKPDILRVPQDKVAMVKRWLNHHNFENVVVYPNKYRTSNFEDIVHEHIEANKKV